MSEKRLILIDDSQEFCDFVSRVAEEKEYDVKVTLRPEDFMREYEGFDPTVVVLDILLPNIDGIELIRWLAHQQCHAPIILVTGGDISNMNSARKMAEMHSLNILAELSKPIEVADLRAALMKH